MTILSKEIEHLSKTILQKKDELKTLEAQLATALTFFIKDNQKNQVSQHQNEAEFTHVSKNVAARGKMGGGAEKPFTVVLKRYSAGIGEQTIQGDWLVEQLAQ